MPNKRDEIVEAAREFLYGQHTLDDDLAAEKEIAIMADFAAIREKALRAEIAGELRRCISEYKTPRAQVLSITANVIEKLEAK